MIQIVLLNPVTSRMISASWYCLKILQWRHITVWLLCCSCIGYNLCLYLWFLVYLWVHLRAEEGEKNQYVPLPEVVLLSTGHAQYLVLNHLSSDHYGSGESQGLTQNAICRMKWASEWMMSEGCQCTLNQLWPQVSFGEVQMFARIILSEKNVLVSQG